MDNYSIDGEERRLDGEDGEERRRWRRAPWSFGRATHVRTPARAMRVRWQLGDGSGFGDGGAGEGAESPCPSSGGAGHVAVRGGRAGGVESGERGGILGCRCRRCELLGLRGAALRVPHHGDGMGGRK